MIEALIRFALIQRLMVLLLAAALTAGGLWAFQTLPIDAFPDISSPQVQVIVKAPGMSPSEVESRITFPIETEMQGLPRQTVLRSLTKYAHHDRLRGGHRYLLGAPAGGGTIEPGLGRFTGRY